MSVTTECEGLGSDRMRRLETARGHWVIGAGSSKGAKTVSWPKELVLESKEGGEVMMALECWVSP